MNGSIVKPVSPLLDPGHPLAQGLVRAWLLGEGSGTPSRWESIRGVRTPLTGTLTSVGSDVGAAVSFAATTYLTQTAQNLLRDHSFSLIYTPVNAAEIPAGGAGSYVFYNAATLTTLRYAPNSNIAVSVTVPAMSVTKWYHAIFTRSGATGAFFLDGIKYPTAAINASDFTLTYVGAFGGALTFTGQMASLLVWDRQLSDNEAAALSVDPYAMFRPRRRTSLFFTGAGGFTPPASGNGRNLLLMGVG